MTRRLSNGGWPPAWPTAARRCWSAIRPTPPARSAGWCCWTGGPWDRVPGRPLRGAEQLPLLAAQHEYRAADAGHVRGGVLAREGAAGQLERRDRHALHRVVGVEEVAD